MLALFLALFRGGLVKQFTEPLLRAHEAKLAAQNDEQRLEAEQTIAKIEAARDIAVIEAGDRMSATRIGRLLIVVPFGLWWSAVFGVSIANPIFGLGLTINDIPPRFWDAAMVLIPAILIADAGALVARKWTR